ncbi:MAG: nuclear transport factor 2 family protein [Dokdonia sp.]|mgnify:CR=1 FL=1|jgi:hypothetical protein|nr:hypothetical protein [Cytophagaceae bacterium]
MNTILKSIALLGISVCLLPTIAVGQQDTADTINQKILALDSLLFDKGFNQCDESAQEKVLHTDFEFYHDQGGVDTGKAQFISSFMKNMCETNKKPIRKLVPEFNEFFPLYDGHLLYGVIQRGVHEFYIKEVEKPLYKTSTAKFTHLWIKTSEGWKIKRVLSFDHQTPSIQKTTITHAVTALEEFTGAYMAPQSGKVLVSVKNEQLYIDAGTFQTTLQGLTANRFTHPKAPLTFEFIRDAQGRITKFHVIENGQKVEEAIRE